MDFLFFEQLTDADALAFLDSYKAVGAEGVSSLNDLIRSRGGVNLDFTIRSVRPAFRILASELVTMPAEQKAAAPGWLETSERFRAGLYEFVGDDPILILRLSYYLGETLIRVSANPLRWGVGDRGSAVQSQPVLERFKAGVQMSPLLVTENLLRRIIEAPDPAVLDDVDKAMSTWLGLVESPLV